MCIRDSASTPAPTISPETGAAILAKLEELEGAQKVTPPSGAPSANIAGPPAVFTAKASELRSMLQVALGK